jgi:glycosyltransferase involved in cell wall biosynthesis
VVAEAMASGLPGIATHVGAIPEMIVDGQNGLLVPVHSPDRLAEALSRLVARPAERQAMGVAGLRLARAHHNAARNAELLFELLRRCSSGASPGLSTAQRDSELVP